MNSRTNEAVPASSVRPEVAADIVAEDNASGASHLHAIHARPEVVVLSMKHYDRLKRHLDPDGRVAAYDADLEQRMAWFQRRTPEICS